MKIELYCTCGGHGKAEGSPTSIGHVKQAWSKVHSGPGHTDTDRATALKADRARDEAPKEAANGQ